MQPFVVGTFTIFQSTRPMRGATCYKFHIFPAIGKFQSTRPMRGATFQGCSFHQQKQFQSTRPMRGATGWNGGRQSHQ